MHVQAGETIQGGWTGNMPQRERIQQEDTAAETIGHEYIDSRHCFVFLLRAPILRQALSGPLAPAAQLGKAALRQRIAVEHEQMRQAFALRLPGSRLARACRVGIRGAVNIANIANGRG